MRFLQRNLSKATCAAGACFGLFLAFCIVAGGRLYSENALFEGMTLSGIALGVAQTAVLGALLGFVATAVFAAIPRIQELGRPCRGTHAIAVFAVLWAICFAGCMVCLVAYWPGVLSYDIPTQTDYVFTGEWLDAHPPLHTLIWAAFLHMEGVAGLHAITWYAIGQSLCVAAAIAWAVTLLYRRRARRWLFAVGALFACVNPVVQLFAITPTKDVLFGACLIMLFIELVDFSADAAAFLHRPARCVRLGAWLVLCCLLRSNMVIAAALLLIVALIAFRGEWRRVLAVFGVSIACVVLVTSVGYRAAGIGSGSSAFASIPFQQIARVLVEHADELPADELAVVDAVVPVEDAIDDYNPRFADQVVHHFRGSSESVAGMRDDIEALVRLWAVWGLRYPVEYADAWLATNVPYWYPFADTPDPYSDRDYIETWRWKESVYYTVEEPSDDAPLHGAYEAVATYRAFSGTPLGLLFSPALPLFHLAFAACALLSGRWKRGAFALALPLLIWLSFMFGPVSNMRYLFPLFCLYPLVWGCAFNPRQIFGAAGADVLAGSAPVAGGGR